MAEPKLGEDVRAAASESWKRYLAVLDPLRPDLFRYCRRLTGDVWDAEDLVQDTLEQGFARLGSVHSGIRSPRAYVLRIASNLWISRMRRESAAAEAMRRAAPAGSSASPAQTAELRDAGAALMQHLAPQERAAVVLKESFEMTLAEIAHVLGTSVGAVKAALHRGRSRLREAASAPGSRPPAAREVIDRFVERYNARDLPGLLELMLDSASIEMGGVDFELGRESFRRRPGWFHHNLYSPFDGKPTKSGWETAVFQGEPVVLVLSQPGSPAVGSVMRLETVDDRVSRIYVYAFCPDAVREVAQALGRPASPMGLYRFPSDLRLPESG